MKLNLLTATFLFFISANAQAIEDTTSYENWLRNTYLPQYSSDTGIYLPAIKLIDDKGESRTLADFKGKIIYLSLWSTDCGSSIMQLSSETQLKKRMHDIHLDSSVEIVNICTGTAKKEWRMILNKYNPAGTNLYCTDTSLYTKWNVFAPPTYILLNTTGMVIGKRIAIPQETGTIDYILYAATRQMNPVDAVLLNYRQHKFFTKNKIFTDDEEGKEYSQWWSSIMPSFVEYHQWEMKKENHKTK